jgi:hypothetical protein
MTKLLLLMLALAFTSCTSSDKGSDYKNHSDDMKQEQSTAEKAPENDTQDIPIGSADFEGTVASSLSEDETSITITISKVIGYGSQIPRLSAGEKTFIVPEGALSVREELSENPDEGETYRFMALYREDMSDATWTLQEIID